MTAPTEIKNVVIEAKAFCCMILHAIQHSNDTVHGLVMGYWEKDKIIIRDAVPVCHGTPTLPIVETAIGLIEAIQSTNENETKKEEEKNTMRIVGWYTAPMHMEDTAPGPVAMRMATNLETENSPSTLIVLQNKALSTYFSGEGSAEDGMQAYGKDFGKQYQDPIATTINDGSGACLALVKAKEDGIICKDLMDNMEDTTTVWYPNPKLDTLVSSTLEDVI